MPKVPIPSFPKTAGAENHQRAYWRCGEILAWPGFEKIVARGNACKIVSNRLKYIHGTSQDRSGQA